MNSTAEKTNIPWREMTREILESEVYKEMDSIQNSSIVYPDCKFLNNSNLFFFIEVLGFKFEIYLKLEFAVLHSSLKRTF